MSLEIQCITRERREEKRREEKKREGKIRKDDACYILEGASVRAYKASVMCRRK